jgi:hypothetical protein
MNNTESLNRRRAARRERRQSARLLKKASITMLDNFSILADFDNLYFSAIRSMKDVIWKDSVIHFELNLFKNVYRTRQALLSKNDIRQGFITFNIHERGKTREIRSVHIEERVVQKCLCDYILIPTLSKSLIYDNGASLRNKGSSFSMRRLIRHLVYFYRTNGSNNGYALTVDFSKYFDNVNHEILLQLLFAKIKDPNLCRYIKDFVDAFGDKSLGLGSQVSQVSAIYYPNQIDHRIKEIHRIKGYGRYMDDFYLIHQSKDYLEHCLKDICKLCESLGIIVNLKKTRITKLSQGIVFLKGKYILTETGKVLRLPGKDILKRIHRKLKKLYKKVVSGEVTYRAVLCAYSSWRGGYKKRFKSFEWLNHLDNFFIDLFKDFHGEVFTIPDNLQPEFPYYKIAHIYENGYYYDKKVVLRPTLRDIAK